VAPAFAALIRREVQTSEFDTALTHLTELQERAPEMRVDPLLMARLALQLAGAQRTGDAATVVREMLKSGEGCIPGAIALRLARALEHDAGITGQLVRCGLADSDLDGRSRADFEAIGGTPPATPRARPKTPPAPSAAQAPAPPQPAKPAPRPAEPKLDDAALDLALDDVAADPDLDEQGLDIGNIELDELSADSGEGALELGSPDNSDAESPFELGSSMLLGEDEDEVGAGFLSPDDELCKPED
jgi:hypothetical protein